MSEPVLQPMPPFMPLNNVVTDTTTAAALEENGMPLKIYFNGPTGQLKGMIAGSLLLDPGASPHPPHQHPEEEFMLVTQGNGEIFVDGKTYQVGPGAMMYCAGNHFHGITNTGTDKMLFYFWKWQA
ncbi:MAG: cupin protein [Bryobacterales bacterium]|jgi:gentisate 1,2-dioxygenase|nr:cupin protein [Bryobacterales bacterium]